MKIRQVLATAAIVLGTMAPNVQAAPLQGDVAVGLKPAATNLETVQYRGRYFGGYRAGPRYGGWRYRGGAWPWVGLAAGVAAGAIIYNQTYRPRVGYYYDTYDYDGPYYYPRGFSGDPREICARNFKSFEWSTGKYTTYGGERRLCPYLQ